MIAAATRTVVGVVMGDGRSGDGYGRDSTDGESHEGEGGDDRGRVEMVW